MADEIKEKKVSKISLVLEQLNNGNIIVNDIVEKTGAAAGTVRVQMYKFFKAKGEKVPKQPKAIKE